MTAQQALTRLAAEIAETLTPEQAAHVAAQIVTRCNGGAKQPSALFAGLLSNTAGGHVPPAPSLQDAVLAARGITPVTPAQPRLQSNGVPQPPDLAAAIRAARGGRR